MKSNLCIIQIRLSDRAFILSPTKIHQKVCQSVSRPHILKSQQVCLSIRAAIGSSLAVADAEGSSSVIKLLRVAYLREVGTLDLSGAVTGYVLKYEVPATDRRKNCRQITLAGLCIDATSDRVQYNRRARPDKRPKSPLSGS